MDILLIKLIGSAALTYLFINSEPTNRLVGFLHLDNPETPGFIGFISRLLQCALCLGFWVTLIVTGNLLLAAIGSLLSELVNRYMNNNNLI